MGISSALFSSISGLNTLGNSMSVIGDNVANVNTVSFKSSRTTFEDVLSQSVSTAAGSAQVGRGVTLSTVDSLFAQGSFETSSTATDMAVGGQGFFLLRAPGTSQADLFSRAGEFRFNQTGDLINPAGNFVQGWSLDSDTGERQGTITDLNLGKSTPPVATNIMETINNLDSRKPNEAIESSLYDNWNGTNRNKTPVTDPLSTTNFDYTSSVKVFDSKGASHDITVYYDRTTQDNQWEFLVTCDPTEDARVFTDEQKITFAPATKFDYTAHKGAGALLYGTINFDTSGNMTDVAAYNVPPDGVIDPALKTNRIDLTTGDSYYSFPSNFTGATVNQNIQLNLGSVYQGITKGQSQVLVSDEGARAVQAGSTTPPAITSATLWNNVTDSSGKAMGNGDTFTFDGLDHFGKPIAGGPLVYTIDVTNTVQDMLTQVGNYFSATATIDANGKLRLTDNVTGPSGMFVTTFATDTTASGTGSLPFGAGGINYTSAKTMVVSTGQAIAGALANSPVISASTPWSVVVPAVVNGDTFVFEGIRGDGSAVDPVDPDSTFTVLDPRADGTPGTVQDLLDFVGDLFAAQATIDSAGRLQLTDREVRTLAAPSKLEVTSLVGPIFGAPQFTTIPGDFANVDGSQQGATVTTGFAPEALATTQFANSSTTIFQDQNGFASGFLQSVSVDQDGIITGHFSNGQVLRKAQVALANFSNLAGLEKSGGNTFRETTESGAPVTGVPRSNGLGSIAPNALEQSNVDIGTEFVKLITTQRGFQANSKMITATDEMLNDLINIKR